MDDKKGKNQVDSIYYQPLFKWLERKEKDKIWHRNPITRALLFLSIHAEKVKMTNKWKTTTEPLTSAIDFIVFYRCVSDTWSSDFHTQNNFFYVYIFY